MNSPKILHQQIENISNIIDGVLGICACHTRSDYCFSLNALERFPMASTYKIPIAVQCLTLIEQNLIKFDEKLDINLTDLRPESGILSKRFSFPGVSVSVENLIRLMMETSDNTATDLILRHIGGPEAVTQRLRTAGIDEMSVNRSTLKVLADYSGIEKLPGDEKCTLEQLQELQNVIKPEVRRRAQEEFFRDLRDTTTPRAMVELLKQIQQQTILEPHSTTFLINSMRRCQTGFARIPAMLPPRIPVAQKTGTLGSVTNDVGIIELPENLGQLIVAIYIKNSSTPAAKREQVIAQIARVLFDYVLFCMTGY